MSRLRVVVAGVGESIGMVPVADGRGNFIWSLTSGSGAFVGVASFNNRTGAITLLKADVTATGLAPSDINAQGLIQRGQPNGYASLDATGNVPLAQLSNAPTGSSTGGGGGGTTTSTLIDGGTAPTNVVSNTTSGVDGGSASDTSSQGGGIAGSTSGGGAELATFGRTSTITAPVLRDFISVKDAPFSARGGALAFATGGTATASSATFTDTTNHPFSSGDVGKVVIIPGAGASGANFAASISAYVNTSQVTLSAAATSTISGAYQFGWDDTTQLQAAEDAVTNPGGTLFYGSDIYLVQSITPKQHITRWAYGASFWVIPNSTGNALWYDNINDNTTIRTGFRLFGGDYHGEGLAFTSSNYLQRNAVWINQWRDVWVRDCKFDGFASSAVAFNGCQIVWLLDCKMTNCTIANNRNVVVFRDTSASTTSPNSLPTGDFFCLNNYVGGTVATAALSVVAKNGLVGNLIIANNDVTAQGFAVVSVELNTYNSGAGESLTKQVQITNNQVYNTGTTNTSAGIVVYDDGGSPYADPTKLADYVISQNIVNVAANGTAGVWSAGIWVDVARSVIQGNRVWASGTNGRCLYMTSNPTTAVVGEIVISNNVFFQSNTGATNDIVGFAYCNGWQLNDNRIYSLATTVTTGGFVNGVYVASSCSGWSIQDNVIHNPGQNGVRTDSMNNGQIIGNQIRNANSCNSTNTGVGNGVYVSGASAGALNIIADNTIVDDRATHQMLFAVQVDTAGGAMPWLTNNKMAGAATATINGGNFGRIQDNWTDSQATFPAAPSAVTMSASPTTITNTHPWSATYSISGGTVSGVTRTRSGGSALPVSPSGDLNLDPGDSLVITYSSVPVVTAWPRP